MLTLALYIILFLVMIKRIRSYSKKMIGQVLKDARLKSDYCPYLVVTYET